jgi:hypothetical protein
MRDIWNRNDGFHLGLNSPQESKQLLDGLAGRSDGSLYGQMGEHVIVDPMPPTRGHNGAGPNKRSAGLSFGTAVGVVVLLMVLFGSIGDRPDKPARPSATRQVVQPPSAEAAPVELRPSGAAAAERSVTPILAVVGTALPQVPMPVIERFGLLRFNLTPGMPLELLIRWQPSDGSARPATIDLSLITRDGRQTRIPVAAGVEVRPGESVVQLAMPGNTPAGKYELLGILSLAGESREVRDVFTLLAPPSVSTPAEPAAPPNATPRAADLPPPDRHQPSATEKYLMHGGG